MTEGPEPTPGLPRIGGTGDVLGRHALRVLEWDRVLGHVAARASSAPGRERVLKLLPAVEAGSVAAELARVDEVRQLISERQDVALPEIPDAAPALTRITRDGAVLDPSGLRSLGALLEAGRVLLEMLGESACVDLGERLFSNIKLEQRIARIVDEKDQILDTASPELARVRKSLRGKQREVVRGLEDYVLELPDKWRVADGSVSIRSGRFVVPVRREARSAVGGIVHDESSTGGTLFVEPPESVERMNALRELEAREAREIQKVLREVTQELRPLQPELAGSWEALVEFDSRLARARTASAWTASLPDVADNGGRADRDHDVGLEVQSRGRLKVVQGRHPLLVEAGDEVVPFDLFLEPDERTLVISGPNTGGKTVFLKTMGLVPLLAQAGILPPVGPGSRLPIFNRVYADIGDEQSIARSLSTFSAHLTHLKQIVESADGDSLVLVDEMGTGTDPMEGAALAQAILETLTDRGVLTLATSHLGQLKRLDEPESGIVNASLQFDTADMAPTFRLVKNRPGRSYGLAIARRLGFPDALMERADGLVDDSEGSAERLLARLEAEEAKLEEAVRSANEDRGRAERMLAEANATRAAVEERERQAEKEGQRRVRDLLLQARAEVEDAILEVRTGAVGDPEAEKAARRRVEEAISEAASAASRADTTPAPDPAVEMGVRVRVGQGGGRGKVVELEGVRATVELEGGLRVNVKAAELEPVQGDHKPLRGGWTPLPSMDASPEVDLRGLRLEEVDAPLIRALDQAVLSDLESLRVIHGKGTGALRSRVGQILAEDPRVVDQRPGGDGEGGAGVTVARLR